MWLGSLTFHTISRGHSFKCAVSSTLFGQAVSVWLSAAVCVSVHEQMHVASFLRYMVSKHADTSAVDRTFAKFAG